MIRFPSISRSDKIAYAIETDWHGGLTARYESNTLAWWAVQYETYGDGMVQHSPTVPVWRDQASDYLASLAKYILDAHYNADDALKALAEHWPNRCNGDSNAKILFYRSLRYDADKKRYYNASDLKVSSSASKADSRKWDEVPRWADGSVGAVFGFLNAHGDRTLVYTMYLYDLIVETLWVSESTWMGSAASHTNRDGETDNVLQDAYEACKALAESWRSRENAERCLRNAMGNMEARKAKMDEAKTVAVANAETNGAVETVAS